MVRGEKQASELASKQESERMRARESEREREREREGLRDVIGGQST